jgi:DNA mismatch endonuclease (patch repair protein)
MADIKSPEERSRNMSAIRSQDTKPELYLRKLLFAEGLRYRKNAPDIPGRPDMYLAKYHTAIFVNGCFWHRHEGCRYAYTPKSRQDFWQTKFEMNVRRDKVVHNELMEMGIKQLIVWECTIRNMRRDVFKERMVLQAVLSFLEGAEVAAEL